MVLDPNSPEYSNEPDPGDHGDEPVEMLLCSRCAAHVPEDEMMEHWASCEGGTLAGCRQAVALDRLLTVLSSVRAALVLDGRGEQALVRNLVAAMVDVKQAFGIPLDKAETATERAAEMEG